MLSWTECIFEYKLGTLDELLPGTDDNTIKYRSFDYRTKPAFQNGI